ncbi:phosphatase PAP2 family protein [Gynuella sp.]|uniref:phosphatase PAP2 family protein n=1 Tax=Gynuella sp. TaxID=2969146 RepID=UPI003D119916
MNIHRRSVGLSALYVAIVSTSILVSGCNNADDSSSENNETHTGYSKPGEPSGVGKAFSAVLPAVQYPLPSTNFAANNADSNLKYSINDNPYAYMLRGINDVWKGTSDTYQAAAKGSGPDSYLANPVIDSETWVKNIQYVADVTTHRTQNEAIRAFLDDRRSKNYSVIDGMGPLTEEYIKASGAYVDLPTPLVTDVTENSHYAIGHNDSEDYAGNTAGEALSAVVQLVKDFRSHIGKSSTSGSKYIYSTPRPWRMNNTGIVNYQGNESRDCTDANNNTTSINFDMYDSSISVVPGLICQRRASLGGTVDSQSLRKDGGYPSGHTNAGILASMAMAYAFPQRFSELVMRGSDLGESRILAGMHSPVDVIGARTMALAISAYVLTEATGSDHADAAVNQAEEYFTQKANDAGMSLYDYAHQVLAENEVGSFTDGSNVNIEVFNNNFYADHDAIKALYTERMTYGLPQDASAANQDPIVPEGAEALLKSRQPYLNSEQRRAVLYTTEIDSGYPLLDSSNGWGRINLLAAADGYGAFIGDVTVTMDAANGGFNAHDWWRNDITGNGKLTKGGSGQLTLTGHNQYSGGSVLEGGTLEAESPAAFGTGDVYVKDGVLEVDSAGTLQLSGYLTMKAGSLKVSMDGDDSQIAVNKAVYLDDASLTLNMGSLTPAVGTHFTLLTAGKVEGEFNAIEAGDYTVSATYHDQSVELTVTAAK